MVEESTKHCCEGRELLLENAALSLFAVRALLGLAANPGELEDFDPDKDWDENLLGAAHSQVGVVLSLLSELLAPRDDEGVGIYGYLAEMFASLADHDANHSEPESELPLN